MAPTTPPVRPSPLVGATETGDTQAAPVANATEIDIEPAPPVRPAVMTRIDPLADRLVRSIVQSLPAREREAAGPIRIGVDGVRNQSHAGPGEFATFRDRLARVLSDAAAGLGVVFEAAPASDPDYRLDGAAYLATRGGFDVWELYLRVSPADRRGIIWRADEPLHMLRQPRPNQPEFIPAAALGGR